MLVVDPSTLPTPELVMYIQTLISGLSREEFEAFRFSTAEALKVGGAADSILSGCLVWAKGASASRRAESEIAGGLMGGLMASAFQLGLLVARAAQFQVVFSPDEIQGIALAAVQHCENGGQF